MAWKDITLKSQDFKAGRDLRGLCPALDPVCRRHQNMIQTAWQWSPFEASPVWPWTLSPRQWPLSFCSSGSSHTGLFMLLNKPALVCVGVPLLLSFHLFPSHYPSASLIPSLQLSLCSSLPWSLRRLIIPPQMTEWSPSSHHFSSSIIFFTALISA